MKTISMLISILLFTILVKAQCTFKDVFPVEHGMSKFKAITKIASYGNIIEDSHISFWDKPDYLYGDSVHKANSSYDYTHHTCFNANNKELHLEFVDDRLYEIDITLTFLKTEFEECIKNYNSLITIMKDQFPFWDDFVQRNNETNEETGEGLWLYPSSEDERNKVKIERLSIGYEIVYEMKWTEDYKEYYPTGNVEGYKIKIKYVNLKGTKLTNKGY